jgi:hypothetical protein
MTEEFIQFIWKYGLFDRTGLFSDSGEEIQVISLGEHNGDSGPDFLNARLKIGPTTWAGNIEIHLKSSDWFLHGHHLDKGYDSVILHVVHQHNQSVTRSNGETITTLELPCNEKLYGNYRQLLARKGMIPCQEKIRHVEPLLLDCWLSSLVVERLSKKTGYIAEYLQRNKGNWEEAFYISLARSFGFGLNSAPFELLARSVSVSVLNRHRDNLLQVEALLMGQAGFLNEGRIFPEYYVALRNEYVYLQKKYKVKPIENHLWKFLRLRPVNFPTLRIAQFANLIRQSEGLFSRILTCNNLQELKRFFTLHASGFWDSHYTFEKTSKPMVKTLGENAFNSLVINTVIPFLFIYGSMNGQEETKNRALELLNSIPPESNRITRKWDVAGIRISSAFYSQAVLQLYTGYCCPRHCLSCSVGTHLITAGIQ